MKSIIVISDIHGSYQTLIELIKKLPKDIPLCFVGDLLDRGLKSKDVIDFVINNKYDCVMGNHEDMAINASKRLSFNEKDIPIMHDFTCSLWTNNGGFNAIHSYLDNENRFEKTKFNNHIAWMEKLPLYIEYKDIKDDKGRYLVVSHSMIIKYWNNIDKVKKEDLLWNRNLFIKIKEKGIFNVFGHTPQHKEKVKIRDNYCCIDTGAVFKMSPDFGVLTALQFPEMKVYQQENVD